LRHRPLSHRANNNLSRACPRCAASACTPYARPRRDIDRQVPHAGICLPWRSLTAAIFAIKPTLFDTKTFQKRRCGRSIFQSATKPEIALAAVPGQTYASRQCI
jgi:hypothetical protein